MKVTTVLILSVLVSGRLGLSAARAQQCPAGTTPWVDTWGNKICRRMDGSTAAVETPRNQSCPTGAFPAVDSWGNKVCRSNETPTQPRTNYYDTSKGCPIGTHDRVDEWGNKVCKPF